MGLDSYLYARKYVSKNNFLRVNGEIVEEPNSAYNAVTECIPTPFMDPDGFLGAYVQVIAGYWRKANQIHAWFVKNVQNNKDDCGEYSVSIHQLEQLKWLVDKVRTEHTEECAMELLPPQQGFFFGGYEIDEWYWEQLDYTSERLDQIIRGHHANLDENIRFTYESSW